MAGAAAVSAFLAATKELIESEVKADHRRRLPTVPFKNDH